MSNTDIAILAGGCFWGVEDLFRKLPGVIDTDVGYTGGDFKNPGYKDVKSGKTGHAEAIQITYDRAKTSYRQLLEFFFQIHDPTTLNRQGNDIGTQYRSAIFYRDPHQETTARAVVADYQKSGVFPNGIVTQILPAGPFYKAEPEHQDYLERYPEGYTCHFIRPEWALKMKA
ncbi:MAG TPA: peptide-methionine (S)-S-oxide reductase MsrA [Parvularculaceae bacterium]|nr:peptide-methionine (S)-S-oxide reductase MsrA [Parvularculaceae bacterium]